MKKKWVLITTALVLIAIVAVASFYALLQNNTALDRETLFQVAVWDSFTSGQFGGFVPFIELARNGDFGIGTVHGLDGEMIALDGIYYQISSEGTPKKIEPNVKTPYSAVTYFDADQTLTIAGLNFTELQSYLNGSILSKTSIYAIKVTGNFDYVLARSPAKQYPPYPDLTIALRNQTTWTFNNVSATAVGYWFPSSLKGVDYVGYHFHIITDDLTAGGHILDCKISNATVELDQTNKYTLILP